MSTHNLCFGSKIRIIGQLNDINAGIRVYILHGHVLLIDYLFLHKSLCFE